MKQVIPDYPYKDAGLGHRGTGCFRLFLDPKTGEVTDLSVLRSTGYDTLDSAVTAALRQWRWEPRRWKQVDIIVTFGKSI